jgi:biopolymer transport protein ExbB
MKKLIAFLTIIGMFSFGALNIYAQDENEAVDGDENTETVIDEEPVTQIQTSEEITSAELEPEIGLHKQLKIKFIEGGAGFMSFILMCLILGLAVCIERIIYLSLSSIDSKKFIKNVEEALESGGIEAAKEVSRNTRGPIASIYYQGLDRYDEGLDVVEKSVTSYGSVQTGLLEKGISWISLFIGIAPMLGFLGTVIGMIIAFDSIQVMGDISPSAVAGGIKIALITTVAGLIVALILQVFYNYIISKVESIVNNMEDASITLLDILLKHNLKK